MVNINKYIKALLHPAGGHQGSHKAHQAGNQWCDVYMQLYAMNGQGQNTIDLWAHTN